tara:strand:- start:346 stop:576 length:231 start_codon:yes stop_codon:yes gene_type:complete
MPRGKHNYSYWWGGIGSWEEGTEDSIQSDTPLSSDDIDLIARKRGHYPVTFVHEWDNDYLDIEYGKPHKAEITYDI